MKCIAKILSLVAITSCVTVAMEKGKPEQPALWKRVTVTLNNNTDKDYIVANLFTMSREFLKNIQSSTVNAHSTGDFVVDVPRSVVLENSVENKPLRIVQIVNAKDMNDQIYFYINFTFAPPAIQAALEAEVYSALSDIAQTRDLVSLPEDIIIEVTLEKDFWKSKITAEREEIR